MLGMVNSVSSTTAPVGGTATDLPAQYIKGGKFVKITFPDGTQKTVPTIKKLQNIKKCKGLEGYQGQILKQLGELLGNVGVTWELVPYNVWAAILVSTKAAYPVLYCFPEDWAGKALMKTICKNKRDTKANKQGRLRGGKKRRAREEELAKEEPAKEEPAKEEPPKKSPSRRTPWPKNLMMLECGELNKDRRSRKGQDPTAAAIAKSAKSLPISKPSPPPKVPLATVKKAGIGKTTNQRHQSPSPPIRSLKRKAQPEPGPGVESNLETATKPAKPPPTKCQKGSVHTKGKVSRRSNSWAQNCQDEVLQLESASAKKEEIHCYSLHLCLDFN
ncbi:hypothetical protein RhiXN_11459 [Rhizoctonia solani]|uniref:Uncharacterized protein n=1 Tax=Rhizoctonia solani TaxID=456999 RepID=A0A8H8P593_9AGAM|nr:uncharacterized protein RhiXN_11459 [Rhizoctonia solani]QRW24547.1 hypothetical protein RhiXN_11459 [Rhizoctonia solani]